MKAIRKKSGNSDRKSLSDSEIIKKFKRPNNTLTDKEILKSVRKTIKIIEAIKRAELHFRLVNKAK